MAYEKRVLVLKQIKKGFTADGGALTGAVYVERLGSELTVTPRLVGIAPVKEGRYALVLSIEKNIFILELHGTASLKAEDAPSLKGGLSVLLVFIRGDVRPIAFASCGLASSDYTPLLDAAMGKKEIPVPLPPNELPVPAPNVPTAPGVPLPGKEHPFRDTPYDDEAIADANYFAEAEGGGETASDEAVSDGFLRPQGTLTYYYAIQKQLKDAFGKYPKDERLKGAFPHSEWVCAQDVLLGIIYEEGTPRYLCVAIPAEGDPPEPMKKACVFVPATPFSETEGFFVVFQSADTGEYVTVALG